MDINQLSQFGTSLSSVAEKQELTPAKLTFEEAAILHHQEILTNDATDTEDSQWVDGARLDTISDIVQERFRVGDLDPFVNFAVEVLKLKVSSANQSDTFGLPNVLGNILRGLEYAMQQDGDLQVYLVLRTYKFLYLYSKEDDWGGLNNVVLARILGIFEDGVRDKYDINNAELPEEFIGIF